MTPPRILVVTNGPLCRNPRVVKEAGTLSAAGYDVTVLTVRNHPSSEQLDLAILARHSFRRIVIDLLPGAGLVGFRRRLLQRLARDAATRLGWKSIYCLGPAGPTLCAMRSFAADLTIVHNEVPHWAGARLLAEGLPIAVDFEDWHSEDLLPGDRLSRPLRLICETERDLLHRAAYTATTSHALADALHSRYGGRRPAVVANSFPLQPLPLARSAADGPPAFFWFSQTLGPGRGLEHFLAAWSLTRQPSRLVLLGETRPGFDTEILSRLPVDFRSRITFHPLVPPADLPALIADHDIGLALEQPFILNRDLTVTNKIIQYLNAGLAVVASDTAGQREVLAHAPAAGLIVETHETTAFAATLDTLLADRTSLAARQRAARRLAETVYCWELEAPRLLSLVESALAR